MQPPRPPRPGKSRTGPRNRGGARSLDQWLGTAGTPPPRDPGAPAPAGGRLQALREGIAAADRALDAARAALPADLAPHLWAATCIDGELALLFESAGWATRARYAAEAVGAAVAAALGEPVRTVKVKVRPRTGAPPPAGPAV